MRRTVLCLIPVTAASVLATAVLAGCGSGAPASPNAAVTVSGGFGAKPAVHIPAGAAGSGLILRTPVKGHGAVLGAKDSFLGNVAVYLWHGKTHRLLDTTFGRGPQMIPAQPGMVGLDEALRRQRVGSRVVAVVPPKDGFGPQGNPNIGVTGTDTTVWVIDVIQSFGPAAAAAGAHVSNGGGKLPTVTAPPGTAPAIAIPKSNPPGGLVVSTLIKGAGAPLRAGQTAVVKYVGTNWRTGKVFDSNWLSAAKPTAAPIAIKLGSGQVIPGWDQGLAGVPVGSRVLLVIPPALGYKKAGNPGAGIKGTDTLVFVVDVLAGVA